MISTCLRLSPLYSLFVTNLRSPKLLNRCTMSSFSTSQQGRSLREIVNLDNTLQKYLIPEYHLDNIESLVNGSKIRPHQVKNAHYTVVLPEPVPKPFLVSVSHSLAKDLGLSLTLEDITSPDSDLVQVMSGNRLIPGLDRPYATVYGCHSHGHWFGQLGDGRALILGEVNGSNAGKNGDREKDPLYKKTLESLLSSSSPSVSERNSLSGLRELQLKGSGRSPYSRGFDGRAVLRSSVREYLASEAMHHLNVPTTRALTLVTTGETIRRAWYASTSDANPYIDPSSSSDIDVNLSIRKFPPDTLIEEPGAIVCRVSNTFLRFGHLELLSKRNEMKELVLLCNYLILREYPFLLPSTTTTNIPTSESLTEIGPIERYVSLFQHITHNIAYMVSQWLRIGYVQGNVNSDNTLLSGNTVDYGPFGFMERYDPYYTVFTSDPSARAGFMRQRDCLQLNVNVLGETVFKPLIKYIAKTHYLYQNTPYSIISDYMKVIDSIAENDFDKYFNTYYNHIKDRKLGLISTERDDDSDSVLWDDVMKLMHDTHCDYTIFFRQLSSLSMSSKEVFMRDVVYYSSYLTPSDSNSSERVILSDNLLTRWYMWYEKYTQSIQENAMKWSSTNTTNTSYEEVRRNMMLQANPKYILRNWMSVLAYERAEQGDYSIIEELMTLLQNPYDLDQSSYSSMANTEGVRQAMEEKYYRKTPPWARNMPGVTFMS